jgi:hypothetical protein
LESVCRGNSTVGSNPTLSANSRPAERRLLSRFLREHDSLSQSSPRRSVSAVDRAGNIGQYRSTRQVAWHINEPSVRYVGIEHIARHKQELTSEQIERSARLIGDLAVLFSFPAGRLAASGHRIHVDFRPTGCGQNAFWIGTTGQRTATFDRLVGRAHDYVTLGF